MQITHILATVQAEYMFLLASGLLYPNVFNIEILAAIVLLLPTVKLHQPIFNALHRPSQLKVKGEVTHTCHWIICHEILILFLCTIAILIIFP